MVSAPPFKGAICTMTKTESSALAAEQLSAPGGADTLHDKLARWAREFHRSSGEEWANAGTHLAGVVFGIFALTYMLVITSQQGDPRKIVSAAIYGSTLVILYTFSCLYHLIWKWNVKAAFQVMDHISIYLLIAGSYTPYTLVTMKDSPAGWISFGIAWGLATLGILSEVLLKPRREWLACTITLLLGWHIVLFFKILCAFISTLGLVMVIVGGAVYSIGVAFYVCDRTPYMHTVWHCFVLGGTICQWVSITFGVF